MAIVMRVSVLWDQDLKERRRWQGGNQRKNWLAMALALADLPASVSRSGDTV